MPSPELVTYILFVLGFTAIPSGEVPTSIVVVTVFVSPSITLTLLRISSVTYIKFLSGFTVTPIIDVLSSSIVATTVFVFPFITFKPLLSVTYILFVL